MSNEEQKSITPGIYLWLIAVNIYISMFAFGGGYVVVPLVRRSFVEKKKIFTEDELMEMPAVAQSSPGAIAVNLAALSGYKAAGTAGAVVATVGCVFCGVAISLTLYRFFQKHKESVYIFETLNGLKAASLGLIVSAAATIILLSFFGTGDPDLKTMKESLDIGAVAIFGGVLFLSRKRKINPIMLMLVSGAAGIILYM